MTGGDGGLLYPLNDLAAFEELTATLIYAIRSRLLAVGLINYRTRIDLVGFDAGDPFDCGDRATDLLQSAFEGTLCDGLGHLDRFRSE